MKKMTIVSENAPLLGRQTTIEDDNDDLEVAATIAMKTATIRGRSQGACKRNEVRRSRHTSRAMVRRCLRLLLWLVITIMLFVVGFRVVIWWKIRMAWRKAFTPMIGTIDDTKTAQYRLDPLQGVRPYFYNAMGNSEQEPINALFLSPPLAIVHGVEITAFDMDREAELLARHLPGTYVQSIEYAPGVATYFISLDDQYQALCLRLRHHPIFGKKSTSTLDILGHSSGAILARAVAQNVESCLQRPNVQVRHYVGLAGPQMGVIAPFPGTTGQRLARTTILGSLLSSVAHQAWVQDYIVSTAAYLYNPRNPHDEEDSLLLLFGTSSFLSRLNQGSELSKNDPIRQPKTSSMTSSNMLLPGISGSVLLVSSIHDQVIQPTESALFFQAQVKQRADWENLFADRSNDETFPGSANSPDELIVPGCSLGSAKILSNLGLDNLLDEERVYFYQSPTSHGPLLDEDYERVIVPFLKGHFEPSCIDKLKNQTRTKVELVQVPCRSSSEEDEVSSHSMIFQVLQTKTRQ